MSFHHSIPCPDCGSPIAIESTQLLAGESFSCSNTNCNMVISLSGDKAVDFTQAFDKFTAQRTEAAQQSE